MSVEITVEPAPTTPVITVNPAGEVTCTVTYSTLTGSINNPGGTNGSVQVKSGTGFGGIAPGAAGQVLTSTGTAWVSTTPASGGMIDPGSNGVVVRTALNTTTARSIAAGTNVSVTNGSGVSGNPTINVPDASTSVKGAVELAADGEAASGLAVQSNDARLSNARTPTVHASTHVTGGTDKIRDATASQDGLMTTAYASKLDGIEASADVTDAANVGAAIHGATEKTTPVDTDTLPVIDSAASNALKKTTWANIKATLKTYFDTLYNLYVLPAPTTTVIGGVKRNTGSAGQFVNGIDTDGSLQYGTPAGGGGAGTVTSVAVSGTDGIEVDSGSPITTDGTIQLGVNAATMKATLDLAGTNTGDQNLFSTIAVSGQSNVVADTTSDTLTLVAGSNVTITTDAATDTITISSTDTNTGITQLTGDVTAGPGSGSQAATIANNAVTFAKMQNISNGHLIGRHTSGSGDPEQVTVGGSLAISGANLERAALTGDVTASSGSNTTTIANNAVTYAKMQNVTAASRLLGRGDDTSGDPQEITIGSGLAMTGTTLSATGTGSGDMTKAVYDPQDVGYISGATGAATNSGTGGIGGVLFLYGGNGDTNIGGLAGTVITVGGNGDATGNGGNGGDIDTRGGIGDDGGHNGGSINTSGSSAPGGSIDTSNGGGSINTRGTGSIGLGATGTRTTIQGAAAADWTLTLPTNDGDAGQYLKTDGAGVTSWDTPAGGVTDGDKGDITVSSSGTVWTIDNDAVTYAKMQNVAAAQLLGRNSASSGNVEELAIGAGLELSGITLSATAIPVTQQIGLTQEVTLLDWAGVNSASGGWGGNYIDFYDGLNSPVRFWFDWDNSSTPPANPGTLVEIDITSGDIIQNKLEAALDSWSGTGSFSAVLADSGSNVVVTSSPAGVRTNASWGTGTGDSGNAPTITITTPGTEETGLIPLNGSLLTKIPLTTAVTGTLPIANGGTGQTTAVAAFDALAPTTTKGDLIVHNGTDNIRVAVGATNGHVLTVDSTTAEGVKWAAGGGGGLTNITETLNTASPNNTVNAEQLAVTGGTTNVDFVLTPKGTGAFQSQIADGTTTGGNKRGARATDFQRSRTRATAVASGADSTSWGSDNIASAGYTTAGGYYNTTSGLYSVALGYNSVVAGAQSFAGGKGHTVSGDAAAAFGENNTASGYGSFAIGYFTNARLNGMNAHAIYSGWGTGGAQNIRINQAALTTDATPTEMFGSWNLSQRYTIPSGNTHFVQIRITAASTTNTASYARQVCIRNTAGTTALVGSVQTIGTDQETDAAWDVTVEASDTNDALRILVTGAASTTIRWLALIDGIELKNP